jgi:hypothetical protein
MLKVAYVYPNVSSLNRNGRGGLAERWALAESIGFKYIEIPADFIKNKTEVKKTGLKLGEFLTKNAIKTLYQCDSVSKRVRYVMHTEPTLGRNLGGGLASKSPLRWNNKAWVVRFTKMVINISRYFGLAAAAIEIHPGGNENSYADLVRSIRYLIEKYSKVFNIEPLILVENRTSQFISTGVDVLDLWKFVSKHDSDLIKKCGIVLDVQQLYTVTKHRFRKEFNMIPTAAIKGFHIHSKHQVPQLNDKIPWRYVFERVKEINRNVIINPEIHHKKRVNDAMAFCEGMLQS